jgi:hypothetical protein
MIRYVIAPRLARSGVLLLLVDEAVPPPDLVIATEAACLPVGVPAVVLSLDLASILDHGAPFALTPESLAEKLLEKI